MKKQAKIFYNLSSHWDREWYQQFQDYRCRLVNLLDRTIPALEDGTIPGSFYCDGQSILLEDYLEVRTAMTDRVKTLVVNGKLQAGPWYVMPDEFLVSGESLIRNLELGAATVRGFGGTPSCSGYICDLFGHHSQMPQIFAGFGIQNAYLWRGIEPFGAAHFNWIAADGTSIWAYRFGRSGYGDFNHVVRAGHLPRKALDEVTISTALAAHIADETVRCNGLPVLLNDGCDHQEFDIRVLTALKDHDIHYGSLDDYTRAIDAVKSQITHTVQGELRASGRQPSHLDCQWLIPGVGSSRVWIKQSNAECEALLTHRAEPLGVLAHALLQRDYPGDFLQVAWKWLIQNHPHDSICGCSIDAVHEDMKYRFAQTRQIAAKQSQLAATAITAAVAGVPGPDEIRVGVFNPLCCAVSEPVEMTLGIPSDWPGFADAVSFDPTPAFRLFDATGAELPYWRTGQAVKQCRTVVRPIHFPELRQVTQVKVVVELTLPPGGYTTFTVRKEVCTAPDIPEGFEVVLPTRHPAKPSLVRSERAMANDRLRVDFESDGTLTVTDRVNGEIYRDWLRFEDIADVGDGWWHGEALNKNYALSSRGEVSLVADTPLLARFKVRTVMTLPAAFDFERMRPAAATAELVIESFVTLKRGSDRLEIETLVHNTVKDHRLRVLFPSGATAATTYLADSAFDVVERPIALAADNHLGREIEIEAKPQYRWTAVNDCERATAVIANGLLESAVRDNEHRTVALTLFRATGRTVMTAGEPEGQLQKTLRFQYWVTPRVERFALCQAGIQLAAGHEVVQMDAAEQALWPSGALPATAAGLQIDGGVVVTSLRRRDAATEVRFFNPGRAAREVVLTGDFHTVKLTDLTGRVLTAPPVENGVCRLTVAAKRIVTLQLI